MCASQNTSPSPPSGRRLLGLLRYGERHLLLDHHLLGEHHLVLLLLTAGLQLGEDLGEEGRLGVDPEHGSAEGVDDEETAVPEAVLVVLHQERLQRVADLVAHVRVGQVQAREHHGLQLVLAVHLLAHQLAHQHVHEHHVGGVDEGDVLWRRGRSAKGQHMNKG